jgi:hypothetical protein
MILASHGIIASQIASFDADAVAFFARVTTAGGTLSTTEKQAVNQLVLDLKANSLWSAMKAIYPMVGASAAACAQNLKSSSFTGSFSTGWTFASTGVQSTAANGYMDTQLLASTSLSTSSAQLSVYINTAPNGNQFLAHGTLDGFLQTNGGAIYGSLATSSFSFVSNTDNAAFYMVNRQGASTLKLIKNSSVQLTATTTGSAYTSTQNMLLNAYTTTTFINNCRYAFASIGDGLTDTESGNLYTAVQNFNTTLSRQN